MDDRIHEWLFGLGEACLADQPPAGEKRPREKKEEQDEPEEEEQDEVDEQDEPEELEHGHDWMVALLEMSQFLKLGSCHLFVFEVANLG